MVVLDQHIFQRRFGALLGSQLYFLETFPPKLAIQTPTFLSTSKDVAVSQFCTTRIGKREPKVFSFLSLFFEILEGSIRGAGQVFGIGDTLPSIFIWIALCLFSPLLTFMCFVGSAIGTVVGRSLSF